MIPFLDVARSYNELQKDLDEAVRRSLASGQYIGGPEVAAFEGAFARYTDTAHCIGVGNGLDALRLALIGAGIGPGDEVLVPSNTFIATWLAVSQTGATPVPVEPDPLTHNITTGGLDTAVTARTRAVVPVHLYGCPAPIDEIVDWADARNLIVIEDAAQAHGASWKGQRIGGHGHAVTWSFYPAKNLGAFGDGGAVTTNDESLAERIRMLGNYGSKKRYDHEIPGLNSRLDPVQAAVLTVKLDHLDTWNERRRRIAARYAAAANEAGLTLQKVPQAADPVWHLFVIRHPQRASLQDWMTGQGIETLIHYPRPPHRQGAYNTAYRLPISEQLASEVLSLPIGPQMTEEEINRITDAIAASPKP